MKDYMAKKNVYEINPDKRLVYGKFLISHGGLRLLVLKLMDALRWRRTLYMRTLLSFKLKANFEYHGTKLTYCTSKYNHSDLNERTIEVPIIEHYLDLHTHAKVIELGAVLQHYREVNFFVLDKFEAGDGILNVDILDFKPKKKFDLLVSISTLEHIGWDDTKDSEKIVKVLAHIRKHVLSSTGKAVISFPLGYNPHLDQLIQTKKVKLFDRLEFMERYSHLNFWRMRLEPPVFPVTYNSRYNNAQMLGIGFID